MGFFWTWRHGDASPASFEKTLSALSTKITKTQSQLDKARSASRRVKVLGTLYLGFAYLVYAIVLILVVGWKNMGAVEWSGLAGGPVVIYLVRAATNAYFSFRIENLTARLKEYQTERTQTIQKLKDATKYDSTLQLLEKYGEVESKPKKSKKKTEDDEGHSGEKKGPQRTPNRTNIPPPATANIPRGNTQSPVSPSTTPQLGPHGPFGSPQQQRPGPYNSDMEVSAEFAPNAFGPSGLVQYPNYPPPSMAAAESHWYDRILDTLLGEDETAPKNRIVLICQRCRLVNGQAPPGTKALSELSTWKCMACGALNGEMDEGEKIVRDVLGQDVSVDRSSVAETTDEDFGGESSDLVDVDKEIPDREAEEVKQVAEDAAPAKPKKRKGKK